ncbi:V-set and immunoglobulin domain-containing protein 10-like [Lates calcarifer]|uniref:V-set and immunoglobulin domain containing 10 like n=1 Tax=Lates calcarifer TaxID=8187 RepID=A0A4W6C0H2_LATCA|nr:V-set and immunoglobulin domain-containing protein 10-like [Lates calcarifer]
MTWMDEFWRLNAVFLVILLSFSFQGAHCELVVSPVVPTLVKAAAGSTVTLAVSFSGAPDPTVTWFKENLPVVTWTIDSSSPPDIAPNYRQVLRMRKDGSLTFVNVTRNYTSNYTMKMTKSGLGTAVTYFTLLVFDNIQNVELHLQPDPVKEGIDDFTLQYVMSQGDVEQQMWFFNAKEIKTDSRYSVEQNSLVVRRPKRSDTGQYTVKLENPFSTVETDMNVTVLYGPDEPILEARPDRPFYLSGDSLSLFCQAEGLPQPTAVWVFGGENLSHDGVLNLTNVQTSQGGNYTCMVLNGQTKEQRQKNMTLNVYERPSGNPVCSVQSVNRNTGLQYHCLWWGGTPLAWLSFPALSNTSSGAGNFNLTVTTSDNLNRKTITCVAVHPVEQNQCNVTASSPVDFLPAVRTTFDLGEGKIVVTIQCVSEASPEAVVSWSKGSEAVISGSTYQISNNTTQLEIRYYNVSSFLLQKYACTCLNPLGSRRREIQLRGPSISDFRLFPNQARTVVTLTWEVPPASVVTGFDIQMKGPNLPSENHNGSQIRGSSNKYRTIQLKPGSARSADVFNLDPDSTYRFRVVPKARITEGKPSEVQILGPGGGLSGPAIAGIAAGIPCSLLFLLLLGGFIYLCVYCNKNKSSRQTRYPVSRAVEKAITAQPDSTPHNLLTGGLKSPPDYNRLHQTPSDRSVALPTFVPPQPVRVATTV